MVACSVGLLLAGAAPSAADAPAYAPLDHPGPPLSVPLGDLKASLSCEPSVTHAARTPVLLNPATGVTPEQNYSWNWEPALTKLGIPWCTYTAPHDTLGDIPTSGEYLVYAIRTMYALAGRRIDVMGHSQGGMSMRWPLRFWPDTRAMVASVIGFAGSNHGTTVGGGGQCATLGCPAADWQQGYESPFIEALNSYAETFHGISYTEIYSHTDEVVQPNSSPANCSSCLHTGGGAITNVATQQVCPHDLDEHLLIGTVDPVAYALAVDALTQSAPADPAAIPGSVCSEVFQPGVNPASVQSYLQPLEAAPGLTSVSVGPLAGPVAGAEVTKSNPPLPCYVYAACAGAQAPTLLLVLPFRHVARGRMSVLHARVLVQEGSQEVPVPAASVSIDGRTATTGSDGEANIRVLLRRGHRYRVTASLRGCNPAAARIEVR